MARAVAPPLGSWPLEMRAETAAAYCDEPSVEAFLAKVARGIYPQPADEGTSYYVEPAAVTNCISSSYLTGRVLCAA